MPRAIAPAEHDLNTVRTVTRDDVRFQSRCACGWRGPLRPTHDQTLIDRIGHLQEAPAPR